MHQLGNSQRKVNQGNADMGKARSMGITEQETNGEERRPRKKRLITCTSAGGAGGGLNSIIRGAIHVLQFRNEGPQKAKCV